MKPLLLCLLCISSVTTSYSQPYQSIYGDSSTNWGLIKFGACDFVCSADYSPESDTIVDSNTFKILQNYGFIREDSVAGKVWFYDEFWSQEFLVMDLSLNVADTFTIYDYGGTPEIFTVDSINYTGGKKHVYLNGGVFICSLLEPLVFVEGTGPNAGFNYQRTGGGSYLSSYMLCHWKDDLKVQGNLLFMDSCEVCMVGLEELNNEPAELIKICDYMGREIPEKGNTPLLYYYSDGTVRRVFVVE